MVCSLLLSALSIIYCLVIIVARFSVFMKMTSVISMVFRSNQQELFKILYSNMCISVMDVCSIVDYYVEMQ